MEAVSGTIQHVVYHSKENGFASIRVRLDSQEKTTIVGKIATSVAAGERIHAKGQWVVDPKYGKQLKAVQIDVMPPETDHGMVRVLSEIAHGVGPVNAQNIVTLCGGSERTKETLSSEFAATFLGNMGIKPQIAVSVVEAWKAREDHNRIDVALADVGLTVGQRARIKIFYGAEEALRIVRKDPFRLADDIDGIGFRTADAIAQKAGILVDDPKRICAAIFYCLKEQAESNGHTCLNHKDFMYELGLILGPSVEFGPKVKGLEFLANEGVIFYKDGFVGLSHFLHMEEDIFWNMDSDFCVDWNPAVVDEAIVEMPIELTADQCGAVKSSISSSLSIITGGPGTGKSTITKAICLSLEKLGKSFALCAPTGRAAKRLSEVTGHPASTIHRLLGVNGSTGGFVHNVHNALKQDVIIVDESSMIDVPLMNSLMCASGQTIFIGDADQLPPVGPGAPFRDMIQSGLESITLSKLTKVHRQAEGSRIVQGSRDVLRGEVPEFSVSGDRSEGVLFFVEEEDSSQIPTVIGRIVSKHIPSTFGIQSKDVQVISPMNRGFPGIDSLNAYLQETLNPPWKYKFEVKYGDRFFRDGDRVQQRKNDANRGVVNGDVGWIDSLSDDGFFVRMDGMDALVRYQKSDLENLHLAYATSVHRSQGGEYPAVVIAMHETHAYMLQRDLLYTAITRAKRVCVIVGTKKALKIAVSGKRKIVRMTNLSSGMSLKEEESP